jgi:hypothetical protein
MTKQESTNLARFGCTLKERTGVFDIDWKGKRSAQAANANIFACLGCVRTIHGPVVLLAFEISCARPLPTYCYFPFDLKRKGHREYVSRLIKTGDIRLSLPTGKGTRKRTHQLTPYLRFRASEIYKQGLQACESIEPAKYDFDNDLRLMERHVRIPELLNRLLLEDTVREISEKTEAAINAVPNENRELARDSVNAAAEAFLPYYRTHSQTFLENLRLARLGSTCALDLHRVFAANPEGLTKFLSDTLAAALPKNQLRALRELVTLVVSFSKLPFKEQSSRSESMPTMPEAPPELADLFQMMSESGITKDAASRFFELLGLEVGGRPGRPPKDYSREYELKASGLSWPKIARQSILENAEIRDEFGGRDFDSLNFQERESLTNRIREGVRSYAERVGKPFPIKRVAALPHPSNPAGN